MQTTLADLLTLPAFVGAEVISGQGQLKQPITWVHVSDIPDAARFLTGGELLLSTGAPLVGMTDTEREKYLQSLVTAGAHGLALELVRHWSEVPASLQQVALQLDFPLLIFRQEVSFAALTRAAHARLLAQPIPALEPSLTPLLLALSETGRSAGFINAHLGPLLVLPLRPRAILLATLDALLSANFNVAKAARSLGVRRQTIYYRLEQLNARLGEDCEEPSRQLGLRLALELMRTTQLN